jgi:hypothetical protein
LILTGSKLLAFYFSYQQSIIIICRTQPLA